MRIEGDLTMRAPKIEKPPRSVYRHSGVSHWTEKIVYNVVCCVKWNRTVQKWMT